MLGGDSHYGGRSVDGSKPDMTEKHKAGRSEGESHTEKNSLASFSRTVVIFELTLFVRPPFCPFHTGLFSSEASSVFINREDTSVSVAVMHTG